jgi:hypothetical protein
MVKDPCRVASGLGQRKREDVKVYEVFVWLGVCMFYDGKYCAFSYCTDEEVARLLLEAIEKKQEEGWSLVEIADHYITTQIWKTLSYKAKSELMEGLIEFLKVKSKCQRKRRFI